MDSDSRAEARLDRLIGWTRWRRRPRSGVRRSALQPLIIPLEREAAAATANLPGRVALVLG
jgi:hypothetical protein